MLTYNECRNIIKKRPAVGVAAAAVVILVAWGVISLVSGGNSAESIPTSVVKQGPLLISISQAGTIEPKNKVILKNEVEGQTSIISIVPEGTHVKKGDLILELDSSTLSDNKIDQEIQVQNAEASYIDARESYSVAQSQAKSDISAAQLTYEFAIQDLKKYKEGEYPNDLKEAQSKITLAEESLTEAQQTLDWSKKLFKDKYLSQTELEADQLSWKQKSLDLETSKNALNLLVNFTHKRQLAQLESDVSQAKMALARTKSKSRASVVQAEAALNAKKSEYSRQKDKLAKIVYELGKTKIYAPIAGTVIYATSDEGGGGRRFMRRTEPLQVGSTVQERQELIHIPNTSGYVVDVSIPESSIDKMKVGLPVQITVDTLPGKVFTGHVKSVSNVVDAQSAFMNPDLKVYDTTIAIDSSNDISVLRTGMSCNAEIIVKQYPDAMYVPVQSVLRVDGKPTVWVVKGGKMKPQVVETGLDNNIVIEVAKGLTPGELVSLTPPLQQATTTTLAYNKLSDVKGIADAAETTEGGKKGTGSKSASETNGGHQGVASGAPPASGANGNQRSQLQGASRNRNGFSPEGFLTRFDTNKDGKISRSEFKGPSEMFSRLDKNGDGYITKDEIPQGRPSGGRPFGSANGGQRPSSGFPGGGQMTGSGARGSGQMPGGSANGSMGEGQMQGGGSSGGAR